MATSSYRMRPPLSMVLLLIATGIAMPATSVAQVGPEEMQARMRADIAKWADVIMMLRIQLERQGKLSFPSLREYYNTFGLTRERLRRAKQNVLVMHPGPMNRGVEIASDVADDPRYSVILDQVTNGVAVRMAVLYLLGGAHVTE